MIAFEAINMKTMIQAAAVILFAASAAHAQQAVQWRVEDGGNGHWYQWEVQPSGISWTVAREVCIGRGGHLATPTVPGENQFIFNLTLPTSAWLNRFGPWLGGYQEASASDYSEPAGGWRWVTGEQWAWTAWWRGEPTNFYCVSPGEDKLHFIDYEPKWNDITNEAGDCEGANWSFLIEWSADCNGDGIVDYGQCHDGTLADYNGNNIPDCCERGEACTVGHYPVQWRVSDGGNGHWYRDDPSAPLLGFVARNAEAAAVGAHLATVTSEGEHKFVLRVAFPTGLLGPNDMWPALGGFRAAGSTQWAWVTGEPFVYAPFSPDPPQYEQAQWLMMWGTNLYTPLLWWTGNGNTTVGRAILEWSADCNNDGIVDYGQILQSQLPDANSNGIPDRCECASNPALPACCLGNLNGDSVVDGADLGILLFAWGPAAGAPAADLNADGQVNGADLGVLLSTWGACP